MRLATFNLESLDLPPKAEVALEERVDLLRPQLERLEADILCLQEVNGQYRKGASERTLDALDQLLAGTDYASFVRCSTAGPGGHGVADVHNLVTLSRWPIESHREIRHELVAPLAHRMLTAVPPENLPASVGFERSILCCDIRIGPRLKLAVLNVHLRAPLASAIHGQKEAPFVWKSVSGWAEGYLLSAWKRAAQALEARMTVDRLLDADPHAAIIIAGDCNAEDHETPLKILVGAEEDTGNGALSTRSLIVLDRSLAADRRFSVLHHGRPQMLDHILASRALLGSFRSIEAHNETLGDELVGYGKTRHAAGSYHAPLVAEFALD
jgi:endonuclease/exonuclease/phosphatase family metal-dependent hydrolase